ncbi:MAG TPA: manganese efflux pump, partial [Myxococcaceae bacterium]|nr:manganese efflux pump [Myxococcaceae bacterium]
MALSTLPTPALLALALGLSMDAVAVALMTGLSAPQVRTRHALLLAGLFGFFQGVMPAVGWLFGAYFQRIIGGWDHWVAFAILAGLGAKMIRDAWLAEPTPPRPKSDAFALTTLLALAVATSLDALAAGFTLP